MRSRGRPRVRPLPEDQIERGLTPLIFCDASHPEPPVRTVPVDRLPRWFEWP